MLIEYIFPNDHSPAHYMVYRRTGTLMEITDRITLNKMQQGIKDIWDGQLTFGMKSEIPVSILFEERDNYDRFVEDLAVYTLENGYEEFWHLFSNQ